MSDYEEQEPLRELYHRFGVDEYDMVPTSTLLKNADYAEKLRKQKPDLTKLRRWELTVLIWHVECSLTPGDEGYLDDPMVRLIRREDRLWLCQLQTEWLRREMELLQKAVGS